MRIALIMPIFSQYEVLHHFTIQLCKALKKQGHDTQLLVFDSKHSLDFLIQFKKFCADFSLTFNLMPPDQEGNFLADQLKIPHLSWLVDSANVLFSEIKDSATLIRSRYQLLASVDRDLCHLLNEMGFSKAFFLPHAAEVILDDEEKNERDIEVAAFESFIDYEHLRSLWENEAKDWCPLFEAVIRHSLEDSSRSYLRHYANLQNLQDRSGNIDKKIVKHAIPLSFLERYLRGLDRVNLIKGIEQANVHVYGSSDGNMGWKECLKDKKNVKVHPSLPFLDALKIMKKSKIVLNSGSWIRDGGHERIFYAMASGALVITTRTRYLEENFVEGKEILFYDLNGWEKIGELVDYYLIDNELRQKIAMAGKAKVLKFHTWDRRAADLIHFISNYL